MKKIVGIILIIIGVIPFILTLGLALYAAIAGSSYLCFFGPCTKYYGFDPFIFIITIFGAAFWYIYLIALILIIIGIILIKKAKVKKDVR